MPARVGSVRTPSSRQRLPASQRREVIRAAALEVFADRGFAAASLDEVATRAGVTKALLYRHFASKAELYVDLLEEEAERLVAEVAAALADGDDAEARLRAGIAAFFAHVEERPFARRLLFREAEAEGEIAAAQARAQRRTTRVLAELLGANPRLLADDPQRELTIELFAQVLKTALNAAAAWWLAHPDTPRETVLERTTQLLLPGLRELEGAR